MALRFDTDASWANDPSVAFIARWEALAHIGRDGLVYPYKDVAGVWTIGYGITDRRVILSGPHTRERMQRLLEHEVWERQEWALRKSPILWDHPDALIAITSFVFNLGRGAYMRSTLKRKIDRGQWQESVRQIKRWKYAGGKPVKGLIRRRSHEAAFLLKEIR